MMFILCYLFATVRLNTYPYQFDEGYVEFWYQIPITDIFLTPISSDSFKGEISYNFVVYEPSGDSTVRQGNKVFFSDEVVKSEKEIAICSDTLSFYSSDILLGKKKNFGAAFKRNDVTFTPIINCTFSNLDTLFSYIEIYGLIPDSLFYEVRYQISNNKSKIMYDAYFKRPKYEYKTHDTISIFLGSFSKGNYTLKLEVFEPALNMVIQKEVGFRVIEVLFDITNARYAWEIKYLVSEKEYKKFLKMDYPTQIKYLEKFWSKRNYAMLWCDSNGDGDYEPKGNLDFEDDFTRDIPIKWTK